MPTILGQQVGQIGYGLAGLTVPPSFPPEEDAIECLRTAAELGSLVFNAGEFYGTPTYNSLVLLSRFYAKYPQYADKVVLSVKGAMLPNFTVSGEAAVIRKSMDNCLAQLGGKGKISTFEMARIDVNIPLETQLNTLKELVQEGKIGSVSLSEVSAETIRRAVKIVDIAAVEVEISLWCTDPLHNGILTTCGELGIPVMSYCPVGRGVLTGSVTRFEDIPEGDYRRMFPRYQPENLNVNRKLVEEIERLADKKKCTTAQVSLGWLLALSGREGMPAIIPIPGSGSPKHIKENAETVPLTDDEMEIIEEILKNYPVAGDRFPAHAMKHTNL